MSQLRSIESTIRYAENLRHNKRRDDPFIEHLRSVLPRGSEWKIFK